MSKLNKFFTLCHIHGNNWGGTGEFEGFTLPKVFELSFINKKLVEQEEIETSKFPIDGLDLPNNSKEEDYQLTYIN
jgi:hypothetical protein